MQLYRHWDKSQLVPTSQSQLNKQVDDVGAGVGTGVGNTDGTKDGVDDGDVVGTEDGS